MKCCKFEILSGFNAILHIVRTGQRQRKCWGMTGYKYTEELSSSMQISIKGSLGQRLISLNSIRRATESLWLCAGFFITLDNLNIN